MQLSFGGRVLAGTIAVFAALVVFSASAHGAPADFEPAPTSPLSPVGGNPGFSDSAVADFDGDGNLDQAIVNIGADNITILLGDGNGNFTQPLTSPELAGGTRVIAAGDFDDDGKADLAVGGGSTFRLLLGDGTGDFTAGAPVVLEDCCAWDLAVGDFDRDGNDDLAVALPHDNEMAILLGDGDGGLAAGTTRDMGFQPFVVVAGDFNGDAREDLAVGYGAPSLVTILLGDGNGDFAEPPTSPEPIDGPAVVMAVGDFDRNGKDDLAMIAGEGMTVLLGDGAGDFNPVTTPFPAVSSLAVGDFDGDGRPDLAGSLPLEGTVPIMLGDGDGRFTAAATSPEPTGFFGQDPSPIAVGDLDGNGSDDLTVANHNTSEVAVLLNQTAPSDPNFAPVATSPEPAGNAPTAVARGDFDDDGYEDLAVANFQSDDVSILLGDGTGDFAAAPGGAEAVGMNPTSVAVGDFDRDGREDLAVANYETDDVSVLLGDGGGGFSPAPTGAMSVGNGPMSVAVGDFDRDGIEDLAVANSGAADVSILLGEGDGDFAAPPGGPEPAGDDPMSVAVGDFDRDGIEDLAVANSVSGDVSILLGDGDGEFAAAPGSPEGTGNIPLAVAVGDLDGDGDEDLAVANGGSNNVSILLGGGTGDFSPAASSPEAAGARPSAIAVGDFDRNGDPDLVVANDNSDDASILLGAGDGDFAAAPGGPEATGSSPVSVALGDFDRDGKDDLALTNNGSNDVSVLLGNAHLLTVQKAGSGAGTVTSAPAGIGCGADCTEDYADGATITLTAAEAPNSDFTAFSANCDPVPGNPDECTTTMDAAKTVTATFDPEPRTLTVTKAGAGAGTVTSSPAGVDCGSDCSEDYGHGTLVTLTAAASGNSDFEGFSANCDPVPGNPDECTTTMDAAKTVTATFDPEPRTLTVTTSGNGGGTVTGPGIDCGGGPTHTDCTETVDHGDTIELTATAAANSDFTTFAGGGCGTTSPCTVTLDADKTVDAEFDLELRQLDVSTAGNGSGHVASLPAGIECGQNPPAGRTDCAEPYDHGESVTLTAHPEDATTNFAGFTGGACTGSGNSCTTTMDAAKTVTATFTLKQRNLTAGKSGDGAGTVTSSPAGIDCGSDCSEDYSHGTDVTLTATAAEGSDFAGFSGAGCSSSPCTVTMNAARAVDASFAAEPDTEPVPDTTPPQTSMTRDPKMVKRDHYRFFFESSEDDSTFTCKLDDERARECGSPQDYDRLKRGRHVFEVFATDAAGNDDASPITERFKVKRKRKKR